MLTGGGMAVGDVRLCSTVRGGGGLGSRRQKLTIYRNKSDINGYVYLKCGQYDAVLP